MNPLRLSIVIPAYNEEQNLPRTLAELSATLRSESIPYEIVVVNDGSPDSGGETRNADVIQSFLEGPGLDVARYEPRPGRASVVARIEGSDPTAPSLCLMGHTDVSEPFAASVLKLKPR